MGILSLRIPALLALFWIACGSGPGFSQTQSLPASTAIPVYFTHTIEAGKIKPGDTITAKSMQVVMLPDGRRLPKGTTVTGHVIDNRAFRFDPTPYAHQQASYITIHFDQIELGNQTVPVNLSVRALANTIESDEAATPHHLDDTDHVGVMRLIGGGEFSPLEHIIKGDDGDAIGYNRKQGVFARLQPSDYASSGTSIHCDGTDTEQSVAIFSPSACGVYGFDTVSMTKNGGNGDGTFKLESRGHTVKLYAGSTALLEIMPQSNSSQVARSN